LIQKYIFRVDGPKWHTLGCLGTVSAFYSLSLYIYIYIIFLHFLVATPTCVSHDVGRIWLNDEYVCGVCDHTRTSMMVYMLGMWPYIEYIWTYFYFYVLVLRYNHNIFKNRDTFKIFHIYIYIHFKYLRISIWTYSK
jgi:hypothetical protein